MLTTAERLRREGEAKGRVEGEARGKREALLVLLRQRFGRLSAAIKASIEDAGVDELAVWIGRVLAASSLEEVLGAKAVAAPSKAVRVRAQPRAARSRAHG